MQEDNTREKETDQDSTEINKMQNSVIFTNQNQNACSLISNFWNSRPFKYKMSDLVIVLLHSQQINIFSISYFSHIKVKFLKICKESHYLIKINKNTLSRNTLNKTSKSFGASC